MQLNNAKSALKKSEWETLGEELGNANVIPTNPTAENIWKDSTHNLVSKLENQTPEYFKSYMKIHAEFLHGFEGWLGAWHAWQRQCFDGLGLDNTISDAYGKLCSSWVSGIAESMDMFESYAKIQADLASDAVRVSNNILQTWTDMYGKAIAFWSTPRR